MRKQDMGNQFSKKTRKKARSIQAQRIFRSRWFKSLVAMGSVVVFCTVYSLIIPAATLTEDQASADAGIVLEEAAPSEPQPVEAPAETPAPEPVQEEAPKEEPVVQAAAAVEEAPAEQVEEAPVAASSETVTETPAEAASTAASTEQSLNESAAAGSGSEETKTENAETANTAAANETAPAEETSGTATDETATEGTDAALTTEETTEEASTADSEESVEETTGKEEEVGTVSELKGTSGNLEAVVRFAEGAGIPENATLAIYGGSADTGKVQDALWSGSMDSIEQSTITTDLSEYVSFAVKDVDGNDITPDRDCSIEISFGSEADLSDPGENKIKKYGTLMIGSDGNVSVTGTSLSTGDGHTYATFSGKLSGNTFGFAVTTADKKVNYLEGLSGKTSDGAVEASLTFGKDAKIPEGSTLTVESASVSESSVLDKLWGNYEGVDKDTVTADDVQFVKFVIRDKDGKEISPETKISVKLTFHHEADLSSAAEGKVKKYNALAVSSDGTITLGSKVLSAENGTTTAAFADVSAKSSLGYAVSSADKKVVYATRLTGKSEDGTIEASLRLTEEAKIPEGSLLKITPVTGESVQKTLLDNIWTDTSIIDPDTIELTDSGLAAVTITDKDGNALKPEADATLTLTFNKEADLKEAARKMVKRAKTVAMTEENVKLSDDGLSAAEGKTKVSYTGTVDGQTFGYAVSTAKQKTNFLEGKLSYEGDGYNVELSVSKDNQIPEGAKLSVSELDSKSNDYQNKLDQAQEAILKEAQKKTSENVEVALNEASAHLYDISLENENGEKIQPNGKVTVKINYDSAIQISKDESMQTVHFDENADERQVISTKATEQTEGDGKKVSAISFDTDGFSVYAIVGAEEKTAVLKGAANTLEATIGNVAFKVSYDAEAGLPDGTKLVVKSVDAGDYSDATAKALDDVEIVDEKYFDISFEYDGEVIEPKADVNVTITLSGDDRLTEGNEVKVVHFENGKDRAPEIIGNVVAEGGKKAAEETANSNVTAAKPNLLRRAAKALATPKTADTGSDSVVNFKSDSFSVYGIVDTKDSSKTKTFRTTFIFTNDDNKDYYFTLNNNPASAANETPTNKSTNEQIVKDGGQLLQVGTPKSSSDTESHINRFEGWKVISIKGTVTGLSEGQVITLPYPVSMSGASEDATVTLVAKYSNTVKITFYDVDNTTILTEADVEKESILDLSKYEAVPTNADQNFLGWSTKIGQTQLSDAIGNSYTVPGSDTSLYPVIGTGHWLRFDKNDNTEGEYADPTEATYTAPVFVTGDVKESDKPEDPTRSGYTFVGWYENAAGTGKEYSFSETLTDTKTLYAKWTPEKVNYRVVYWEENPDDDEFSYYRSEMLTGTAGQITRVAGSTLTDENGNVVEGFHIHNSTETDHSDPIHLEHKTQDSVIKGDGTTVINIYYDRDVYNIYFIKSDKQSNVSYVENSTGDYYYYPGGFTGYSTGRYYGTYYYGDGSYYDEDYYEVGQGPWSSVTQNGNIEYYYSKGWSYNLDDIKHSIKFTRYNRQEASGTIKDLTITAKYGALIENLWPSRRTDIKNPDNGNAYPVNWKVNPDPDDRTYKANISTMPLNGAKFYYQAEDGNRYTMNLYYRVQSENGDNSFTLDHMDSFNTDNHRGWQTSSDDYYDLRGFTPIFESKYDAKGVQNYILRSDLTGVSYSSDKVGSDFKSEGNNKYKVDLFYARNRYKIHFTPNDSTNDITAQKYYQESISDAAPEKYKKNQTTYVASNGQELIFNGWYDNPDGRGDEYDLSGKRMPATDIHLYGKWKSKTYTVTINPNGGVFSDNTTDIRVIKDLDYGSKVSEGDLQETTREDYKLIGWYVKNTDGTESVYDFDSPITSDITLLAHWRKTGSYGVHYVITGSTTDPATETEVSKNDTNVYADFADVTVLEAPEANQIPTGYEFVGWSDGTTTYKPGATFTLDASKAGTETITAGDKTVPYVTLTAIYTKLDTTYVHYNINYAGGTGILTDINSNDNYQRNIHLNTAEKLSGGAGFTRVGYKLLAWNTNPAADGSDSYASTRYQLRDIYGVDGKDGNELYAEWVPVYVEVEFTKTDKSGMGLPNATFILSNGTDSQQATSGSDGKVSFKHSGQNTLTAVLASTTGNVLTLTETTPPTNYKAVDGVTYQVTYDPSKATLQDGKYYVTGTLQKKTGDGAWETATAIENELITKDIVIEKVDSKDSTKKLTGAKFKLTYGKPANNATATSGITDGVIEFDNNSSVAINGLPVNTYTLTETSAPDGYIINNYGHTIVVSADSVTYDGHPVTADANGTYTIRVANEAGKELPSTGGSGTLPYTLGGIAIISMAAFMYVYLLRRNKQFKG